MGKGTPITEQFQPFVQDVQEGFWGDLSGRTRLAWKKFFDAQSERDRERYCGWGWRERGEDAEREHRNGY